MGHNPNRVEAERLLGIADKLLQSRDLSSSREFAVLAQETEPLIDGSDQILAIVDVLLAADRRVNNHHDWYAILQLDRRSDDPDLIKRSYRRLALLLHPDKNKYAFAEHAFKLVVDAWAVLSDPARKPVFDTELNLYSPVDLTAGAANSNKLPVRRGQNAQNDGVFEPRPAARLSSFWTACPYCYILYEYPGVYEKCCLRCENCKRGFEAVVLPNLPPIVAGQDAYYCCWGFFPMGFVGGSLANKGKGKAAAAASKEAAYPTWMPPIFTTPQYKTPETSRAPPAPVPVAVAAAAGGDGMLNFSGGNSNSGYSASVPKKRGRPRKFI
ncbi:uncharacterized protein LOC126794444 [Argentina anserina]|uniref:uncharacterized protein LOC126794444 n=1 Tax=Argentina anserina TaxID=57926 RepID=UPI002176459F|nr:uncharacterized protein LOC126794444 [Potentilla anserina]